MLILLSPQAVSFKAKKNRVWAWRINSKGWKLTFPHCGSIISYLQKTKTALCFYMCIHNLHTKNLINSESVILFLFVFFPCLTPWHGWIFWLVSQKNEHLSQSILQASHAQVQLFLLREGQLAISELSALSDLLNHMNGHWDYHCILKYKTYLQENSTKNTWNSILKHNISVRLQRKFQNNSMKISIVSIGAKTKTNMTRRSAIITFMWAIKSLK